MINSSGAPRFMAVLSTRFIGQRTSTGGRPWHRSAVTDGRGGLPSRSGTGSGRRRSDRCRRRRRRGTGGTCGASSRSSDRTASSGRRRRWPARPATAATARCGACRWPPGGRRSSPRRAARRAPRSTPSAGMLRSRVGVAGRSAVWTGVSSSGRSSYRQRRRSEPHQPRSIHSWRWGRSAPIVVSSPWPGSTIVSGSSGEQAVLDRPDDRGEVAALERGVARAAGEQRVAAEQHGRALEQEAHRPGRVARA